MLNVSTTYLQGLFSFPLVISTLVYCRQGLVYIIGNIGIVIKCLISQGKHDSVVGYFS